MKFFRPLVLTLLFVTFVAGVTYVTMHRLDDWGLFADSSAEEVISEYEPEEASTYPFIIPMEGPEVTGFPFEFSFLDDYFSVQAQIDHRVYHGAMTAQRGFLLTEDAGDEERFAAIATYYNKLTFDPEMDDAIDSVIEQMRSIRDDLELNSDQYIELMTKFVQTIPYDEDRGFVSDLYGNEVKALGDPRMPIQVLVDGKADCDEKVMLLAALLTREGFGTSVLFFEAEQHMALGVRSAEGGFAGTGYEFVETTGLSYVSEIPEEFIGGIVLESDPVVLLLDPGEATGGNHVIDGHFSAEAITQVARIIEVRNTAETAAEEKRAFIESTPMTEAEFERENALFQACITAMNSLRATVDNLGYDTGDFMDRSDAIEWINQYAWWE
ncbi:MAG: hypothetical protein FWE48_06740 [Coriobacteriia bacterium]|nr:hypothetical protein [Coriobacteriia bacterium]MCL2871093.1 hypothetical protein [Coriobacteriia bacterium]